MTLEEFSRQLEGIGQSLEQSPRTLVDLAEQILSEMRFRVPVDTGALRNSLRYQVEPAGISFSMLDYGQYQNYGVRGQAGPLVNPVPLGVQPQPSSPPFYAFKSRAFGIVPQPFYDVDQITDQVVQALQNQIEEI